MRDAARSRTRRWLLAAAALLSVAARGAVANDSFAVVSLVGDTISIVAYQGATGSSLDRNTQQRLEVDDRHFDRFATRVAFNALRRVDGDAVLQAIELPDRGAFGGADALSTDDAALPALLSAVRPLLTTPDTHYLVVLGKSRGDAHLHVASGTIGTGKLTGLGFYLDAYKRMRRTATGEVGRGFIAPYAYLDVTLVDLRTGAIVRHEHAIASTTRANVGPDADFNPWNALSADERIRLLENVLARAVRTSVAHVVAAPS